MKRLLVVAVVLGLMLLLGYASMRQRTLPRADFTYAVADTIKTLDPARTGWNEDIRLTFTLWEGLAIYHPETTTPIEGVAYLPPEISADRQTYRFTLREEARWSNGDPVTAHDFVYAWRRAIEPGTAHVYSFLISENIAGAKAYSDWRNGAVRALRIMGDLATGKAANKEDRQYVDGLEPAVAEEAAPDWSGIAQRYRETHLALMEEEFGKVGIKALDDHHLEVRLARPTAYFLDLTAFSTFLPIHQSIEMLRVKDDPTVTDLTLWVFDPQWVKPDYHKNGYPGMISNGAFRITGWQFKRYMFFEKNPHYWDREAVKSESVMVRIITSPSTAFLAYERGDLDWFRDLTRLDFAPALAEKIKTKARDDIHLTQAFGTYFYYFNCMETLPDGSKNPFADARVRMAFTLAVDRQAIVEKVRKVGNKVARNFVPPGTIEGYYCPPGPDYDPEKAHQLLAEAGYPGGEGMPSIEILYNKGYGHEKTAEAVAQMWEETLDVKVIQMGKEMKSFDEDKTNHRFTICRASWYGDYADPTTFLDMMITGNGQNDAAFSYPEYDRIMAEAAAERDPQERLAILSKAERLLVQEQVPFLPIYYYVNLMSYRPVLKGMYPNARDMHPFKYVYVED